MDSYANTPHSEEHSPSPIFFPPVPPDGQSSTYQTSVSNPINIPCPAYPVPGILTPPDTPTSPFGFALNQQLSTGTPTQQNVSFCVSTAYESSAQTNDGIQNNAAFVPAGKPLLRKKKNPVCLRPGLRLNTNLEVKRHVLPVQDSVSHDTVEAGLCNEIEAKLFIEMKAKMCDEIKAEVCDEIEAEICDEIEAELCNEIETELASEVEAEICIEMEAELGDGVEGGLDDETQLLKSCVKTQENESSDVEMSTHVEKESRGEKDSDRELRVLFFIGSDLRKIADQFQATYTRVDWMLRNGSLNFTLSTAITGCLSISMMCLAIGESPGGH